MKKIIIITIAVIMVLTLGFGITSSANTPSAKATAKIGYLNLFSVAASGVDDSDFDITEWDTILTQTIKTGSQKDLFIDVSLQTGMFTSTIVKSKGMTADTSLGFGAIRVMVVIDADEDDEQVVFPGHPIFFDTRIQRLSATLQGEITSVDPITITDPEVIDLFIGTLSAHSFNFVAEDLPAGDHTVTVCARGITYASSMEGSALALAAIGLGSMTVEEVRMIKGEDIYFE
jgi:hypothetical protein